MPSTSPSARTDCPSTASRGDGQQTRHESGQPCRLPQETHDTPSATARRTRRPYTPSTCPPRSNRQSQQENARTSEEGEEEHEGRKGEKMRTCARLPAVLPSKSYIDRTPPPNGQPSTAPGQQAPQPAPAEAPSLPTYSRPFLSLSILLLESLQNPGLFSPVSRRTTAPHRLPGRHRHRGSLHIFAPAPFLTKRLSTSTLSRTPHIPIFHSGTISTIPQQ